jgi:hypothetical protein
MKARIIAGLLAIIGIFAVPVHAEDIGCSSSFGGCTVTGDYDAGLDVTFWGIACNDGYSDSGVIGGNEVPAICG